MMKTIGFLTCSLIGYVIGHFLLTGAPAAYASSIVSYHLYLVILIFLNEKKAGVSMAPVEAASTHLAFLILVVGLPYLRAYIPFFSIVTMFIPALAPFEVEWLFSKGEKGEKAAPTKVRNGRQEISIDKLLNEATGEDHGEFMEYMKKPGRKFSKSGRGLREEYAYWLADRAAKKSTSPSNATKQRPAADAADA